MRHSHLYHKDDERFVYLPFHIESMPRLMDHLQTDEQVLNFLNPLHTFITDCLERGENVMVHCLVGAHRAGTVGVSFLMKQCNLSYLQARK